MCAGARYVTAGAVAGPIGELDLRDLSFFGCAHPPANVFTDLVGYIEAEEIHSVVARTFTLLELRAAQETFLAKSHVGKIEILLNPRQVQNGLA